MCRDWTRLNSRTREDYLALPETPPEPAVPPPVIEMPFQPPCLGDVWEERRQAQWKAKALQAALDALPKPSGKPVKPPPQFVMNSPKNSCTHSCTHSCTTSIPPVPKPPPKPSAPTLDPPAPVPPAKPPVPVAPKAESPRTKDGQVAPVWKQGGWHHFDPKCGTWHAAKPVPAPSPRQGDVRAKDPKLIPPPPASAPPKRSLVCPPRAATRVHDQVHDQVPVPAPAPVPNPA